MKNKKLFAILTLVCFMFTLMPVAAFAAADYETSSFIAVDGDQTVRLAKVDGTEAGEGVDFALELLDATETETTGAGQGNWVAVWAVNANGTVTSALNVVDALGVHPNLENVYYVDAKSDTLKVQFTRTGEYTVFAGIVAATADEMSDIKKFDCEFSKITVKAASANPANYKAETSGEVVNTLTVADNKFANGLTIVPNNVMSDKIFVNFEVDGKALKGETVAIETNSSSIEVNKASDVTNSQGQIDFKVAGSVEGNYEITLTVDGVEWVLKVTVGNTAAAYIATEKQPANPQALYSNWANDKVEFKITDINGNNVADVDDATTTAVVEGPGMEGILNDANGKYVVLTEKPADSDLDSEELSLAYNNADGVWYLAGVGNMDAEGTYTVKVILDNGAFATASWEVKKFGTPVTLLISETPDSVELGAKFSPVLVLMDANGVTKAAGVNATLAATGYAIADLSGNDVTVKTDEKYAGSVITLTAVSEKYDLVATKEVKVAAEAVGIEFVKDALEVNVNNKVEWNVVDAEGNKVSLASKYATGVAAEVKYVVLDKPADAKVSVTGAANIANFKGAGEMAITSNKVGNVTVQVVAKVQVANGTDSTVAKQTKYYTGTEIFAVGTKDKGDVVVMSVGSNEIVINDAKAAIDAAPIVENNRTFVPFRALAEAFGATVAFDEATQAVTAELNGVTVVMTIGSAEYTVNGVAKTADVAPFINGSRTMVPVRFAAEAFGIKVIPTYDENGATADILFNL